MIMGVFTQMDVWALGWFLLAWLGLSWLTEASPWSKTSLSYAMNQHRRSWIKIMAERELRMIDTAIMAGLQNGTAFFASTSLIAVGSCFALFNYTDRALELFSDLPLNVTVVRGTFEAKVIGITVIYAYAFFKFGWAYRVFNYASILVGAVPLACGHGDDSALKIATERAAQATVLAGRHFNRGLRAFFMSIGYLGWFLGPVPLLLSTTVVLIILIRRQFFSDIRAAVLLKEIP